MADYDYKAGKKRIDNILNNKLEVIEQDKLPSDNSFTFENGYYSWVSGVFVDIRKSSVLFIDEDKEKVSKIVKSFTSEIIEILRDDDNLREIGIRGDCVYAIYTTADISAIYELANKTFYINTFIKMLNTLLNNKGFPKIYVGIGMSTAKELVVKAGRKDVGINNKVWIGDAVTKASNLSSLGSKNGIGALVYSYNSYINFIEILTEVNSNAKSWFTEKYDLSYGKYYHGNIIISEFDKWIDDGMI